MELGGGVELGAHPLSPPTCSLVVPYLWRPEAEVKAVVVSQGLNTALVPICYLDKWLFANVFVVMER